MPGDAIKSYCVFITSNEWMVLKIEFKRMWKDVVVAKFLRYFTGGLLEGGRVSVIANVLCIRVKWYSRKCTRVHAIRGCKKICLEQ